MFSKPIESSIRTSVLIILKAAKKKADIYFTKNITAKINRLDDFETLKFIDKELRLVKRKIKKSKYPFYIENCNSPDWIVSQFASRAYLLNIDESEELKEAVFIGVYRNKLRTKVNKLLEKTPVYSYDKFINGEINNFFLHFPQYRNLSEEDFYKIIKWQSENVIYIISYESSMLIKKIQNHCLEIDDPFYFLRLQNTLIENLICYKGKSPNELKELLSKLYFFEDFDFGKFDNSVLMENYKLYRKDDFQWHKTDYNSIKKILDIIKGKPTGLFSNEFLVFRTIDRIGFWINGIINESQIQNEYIIPDYQRELENVQFEAQEEIEKLADTMYDFINNEEHNSENIKKYLLNLYENNRFKYNKINDKGLLHMLADDRQDILINYFTTNAFFRNNTEQVANNLKELIIVREVAWDILVAHDNFFDNKNIYDTIDNGFSDINLLINKMVLNKKLYKAGKKAQMDFFSNFHKYSLPIDYHFQNVHDELKKVFSIAIKNLQKILDDAEPSNKVIYLQSRIKEIKHSELLFKQYDDDHDFKRTVNKYSNLFKEFLTIEAEFLKETINISLTVPEKEQPKLLESNATFDTILNRKNQDFIIKMLDDLSVTIDGKAIISERKKGSIRGIVEALKEHKILPNKSLDQLCKILGDKIDLKINSKLDVSNVCHEYKTEANKYISANYII